MRLVLGFRIIPCLVLALALVSSHRALPRIQDLTKILGGAEGKTEGPAKKNWASRFYSIC